MAPADVITGPTSGTGLLNSRSKNSSSIRDTIHEKQNKIQIQTKYEPTLSHVRTSLELKKQVVLFQNAAPRGVHVSGGASVQRVQQTPALTLRL